MEEISSRFSVANVLAGEYRIIASIGSQRIDGLGSAPRIARDEFAAEYKLGIAENAGRERCRKAVVERSRRQCIALGSGNSGVGRRSPVSRINPT
jgi:hypothetical protein